MHEAFIILGASRGAREQYWFIQDAAPGACVVFADDVTDRAEVDIDGKRIPVIKDWDFSNAGRLCGHTEHRAFRNFVIGTGEPGPKRIMVGKALERGLEPARALIGANCIVRPDCRIGRGGIIGSHSTLTTDVTVGDYVTIFHATVGSETTVGDFSTLYAGTHVASGVQIGQGVSIGAATVVRENVRIADNVVTGAQSCVTRDIDEPGITVVGIPARPIRRA